MSSFYSLVVFVVVLAVALAHKGGGGFWKGGGGGSMGPKGGMGMGFMGMGMGGRELKEFFRNLTEQQREEYKNITRDMTLTKGEQKTQLDNWSMGLSQTQQVYNKIGGESLTEDKKFRQFIKTSLK